MSTPSTAAQTYLNRARELARQFSADAAGRDTEWGQPQAQINALKAADLLNLPAPRKLGGAGLPFSTVHQIIRILAAADASLAHIYAIHHVSRQFVLNTLDASARETLWQQTLAGNWLWANAANMAARKLAGQRTESGWLLNGEQPFCSGSHVANRLHIAWNDVTSGQRVSAILALPHAGVSLLGDWNGIGMRQTGSGTLRFENVHVPLQDVLPDVDRTILSSRMLPVGPVFANILLGIGQGALAAARDYTLQHSRPAPHAPETPFAQEQGVRRTYGELYARLLAAESLIDRVLSDIDTAQLPEVELTAPEVARLSTQATAARNFATEVSLDISSRIFEVTGARSATTTWALDRYWRDARTISLHDSQDWRVRNVGEWYLSSSDPGKEAA